MIRIHFDPRRLPALLATGQQALPAIVRRLTQVVAQSYVAQVREYIDRAKPFTSRTGALRRGIRMRLRTKDAVITVEGPARHYWRYVEEGTRAHVIRPRRSGGVLAFVREGKKVFARSVQHPGTQPRPFLLVDREERMRRAREAAAQILAKEIVK